MDTHTHTETTHNTHIKHQLFTAIQPAQMEACFLSTQAKYLSPFFMNSSSRSSPVSSTPVLVSPYAVPPEATDGIDACIRAYLYRSLSRRGINTEVCCGESRSVRSYTQATHLHRRHLGPLRDLYGLWRATQRHQIIWSLSARCSIVGNKYQSWLRLGVIKSAATTQSSTWFPHNMGQPSRSATKCSWCVKWVSRRLSNSWTCHCRTYFSHLLSIVRAI